MNEKQNIEWIVNAVKLQNNSTDEVQAALKKLESARKWLTAPENLIATEAEMNQSCPLRSDTVVESLTIEEALQNASAVRECQIILPRVITEE